jgi:hypothetical protein
VRPPRSRLAALAAAALLAASAAAGQAAEPAPGPGGAPGVAGQAAEPGSELVVYLMTMGEGDLVWERFGHNAIWIHDTVRGTGITYHWGLFDFDEPGFLRRFIQGRMWYSMGAADVDAMVGAYIRANRSVWVQELNLSPLQRRELADFVEWNLRPENRFYRYDYYYDNCSTRIRDALDLALGGQIRRQTGGVGAGETFRTHTRRLTTNDVLTYTGLAIGLGPEVDREITLWEEMFLPLAMRETVRELLVEDGQGGQTPMVLSEQTYFVADRPPLPASPPRWWPGYLLVGLALGGAMIALAALADRSAAARAGLAGLGASWGLVAGLLGVVLAGLWGLTDHMAAYRNENLFQLNPLALALVVLVPAAAYRPVRLAPWPVVIATALAGLSVLGLVLGTLPLFYQVNGEIIAIAAPVHVALAIAVYLRTGWIRPVASEYETSAAGPAARAHGRSE